MKRNSEILTLLIDRHVERISRRMCNLAYVTWVVAQNLQLLTIRLLADNVVGIKVLALERAFDRKSADGAGKLICGYHICVIIIGCFDPGFLFFDLVCCHGAPRFFWH
ncbi:hypothetical protein F3Y22_tig00005974pilonHSYRG00060 [Hibiscus syriacus]|uniref:Uncharacterized protein n=1 Tax=Hibiscus syriacus TaxID=106335 RepID=A0A6A3CDJ1_HIBSY|nr:hypothetical protein F3Y22_tig00005974pilonHSYRG00060 [Hibiscus syriacus]